MSFNAEPSATLSSGVMLRKNLPILNRLNKTQPKHLQRNPESQVTGLELCCKIRLSESTVRDGWIVCTATHGPELMYATISTAIGAELKPHFPDWTVLLLKRGDHVQPAEAMWD
jgi:hypothetical protein